jgi:hypothetical protein
LDIRGRELIAGQFVRRHPSEFIATQGSGCTAHPLTLKQVEGDGLALIVVIDLEQVLDGLHLHGQLFHHLSFEAGFQGLSRLLLPARELPISCKMAALRPSRDEELSIFPDESRGHMKMVFRHLSYQTYLPKQGGHHRGTEDTEIIFCLSGDTDKQK